MLGRLRGPVLDVSSGKLPAGLAGTRFDVVISTEVIEHPYDPRDFLAFARRILPGGGDFIVSTPYRGYLKNLALAVSGKLDSHFTVLWDGGHIKFFSRHAGADVARAGC
jgi:2-polyprenyl-3-methyl-5-hydroxy-6-metoxy-1,4-benzoquinol methylase